jgi:hypothetical protein
MSHKSEAFLAYPNRIEDAMWALQRQDPSFLNGALPYGWYLLDKLVHALCMHNPELLGQLLCVTLNVASTTTPLLICLEQDAQDPLHWNGRFQFLAVLENPSSTAESAGGSFLWHWRNHPGAAYQVDQDVSFFQFKRGDWSLAPVVLPATWWPAHHSTGQFLRLRELTSIRLGEDQQTLLIV